MALKQRKRKSNLRDVAREAGVSVATVSRVLNAPDIVNAKTRARVEAVIANLGFVRSAAARNINTGRSKIIGALVPTLDSDIFALTLDAMESSLTEYGLSLVVATTDDDADIELEKARALLDIGVEGLIISGVTHNDALHALIRRTQVPTIAISYYDSDYHLPTIGYDNRNAAHQAFEHLVSLGHQKIALVHGPAAVNDRTRKRMEAAKDFDVDVSHFETELSVKGGNDITTAILEQNQHFDAFLCLSDVLAFGVMFALQRFGLHVPLDTSVMGIHDLPSSSVTYPALTTIRLPAQDMGRQAARAIAGWVENDVRPNSICLPTEQKIRESTAPRRS